MSNVITRSTGTVSLGRLQIIIAHTFKDVIYNQITIYYVIMLWSNNYIKNTANVRVPPPSSDCSRIFMQMLLYREYQINVKTVFLTDMFLGNLWLNNRRGYRYTHSVLVRASPFLIYCSKQCNMAWRNIFRSKLISM